MVEFDTNNNAPARIGVETLSVAEVENVSGGIPWLVIPLIGIATHLASEYYHHHA